MPPESRKPEHPDIIKARQDVNAAADEHAHAKLAFEVTGQKLQQARERLEAEMRKPRRE